MVEQVSETVITWWENRHYVMKWQFNWRRLYRHSISDFMAEDDGEQEGDEDAAAQELEQELAQELTIQEEDTARQEPAIQEEDTARQEPVAIVAAGQPLSQPVPVAIAPAGQLPALWPVQHCSSYKQWHADLASGNAPPVLPEASQAADGFLVALAQMRTARQLNWASEVHILLMGIFHETENTMQIFGSVLYGLDMIDSDLNYCVHITESSTSVTDWVTKKLPDILKSSQGVEKRKICDWKRTVEMKFQGHWCDIMISIDPKKEIALEESRLLKEALGWCTVAQRSAINLLVAWAKHSGLAKTKDNRYTVQKVGFKGIHWARMGISALLYCEQCEDQSLFIANVADMAELVVLLCPLLGPLPMEGHRPQPNRAFPAEAAASCRTRPSHQGRGCALEL